MSVRLHSLPVEIVLVNITRGEHKEAWFAEMNPLCQLPFYTESEYSLAESCAILWYLCETHSHIIQDHWYPSDLKRRTRVVSLCHWYHTSLRSGCAQFVQRSMSKKPRSSTDEQFLSYFLSVLRNSLWTLESHWLRDARYLCGDLPCVADILFCCEIEQLNFLEGQAHGPYIGDILVDVPRVRAWVQRVAEFCTPSYESVHRPLRQVTVRLKNRRLKGVAKL